MFIPSEYALERNQRWGQIFLPEEKMEIFSQYTVPITVCIDERFEIKNIFNDLKLCLENVHLES